MSRCVWARPPVPMKPMPIRSFAPRASARRMVKPGTTAAAPAAPKKPRRLVAALDRPVIGLGVSRIVVLLEKRKSSGQQLRRLKRRGCGMFRRVGFFGERPGLPSKLFEACCHSWESSPCLDSLPSSRGPQGHDGDRRLFHKVDFKSSSEERQQTRRGTGSLANHLRDTR